MGSLSEYNLAVGEVLRRAIVVAILDLPEVKRGAAKALGSKQYGLRGWDGVYGGEACGRKEESTKGRSFDFGRCLMWKL